MSNRIKVLSPAAAVLALAVAFTAGDSKPAAACDLNSATIGDVCIFAFDWCPRGFARLNGQILTVREETPLFSLIGFAYGGDNSSTFGLPNMQSRELVSTGLGTGLSSLSLATQRGVEQLVLTSAMTPLVQHTHTATFAGTGGGGSGPMAASVPVSTDDGTVSKATANQSVYPAGLKITDADGNVTYQGPYTTTTPTGGAKISGTVTGATGITGGTVAVSPIGGAASAYTPTVPPQLALTYCVVVDGIYPSRP